MSGWHNPAREVEDAALTQTALNERPVPDLLRNQFKIIVTRVLINLEALKLLLAACGLQLGNIIFYVLLQLFKRL